MRSFAILAAVATIWATPAFAQEASADPARARQLALAERYLDLTQGGELLKQMRQQVEEGYDESSLPADQRAWMVESMADLLEEVMRTTLAEMRDDVADSFTTQELEAAIAFYESPLGRSVLHKQVDMNAELQDVMTPLLIPRMGALMEKFCQRFDCGAATGGAAKETG
jgi:hypothetical protein